MLKCLFSHVHKLVEKHNEGEMSGHIHLEIFIAKWKQEISTTKLHKNHN